MSQPPGRNAALRSFPPICSAGATRLILGSMPGEASLRAGEYYAHPRNAFWMIAESLFGIARASPYPDRVRALETAGIAVWDVLQACRRAGSLDSSIERDSIVANDFRRFLRLNPGIGGIYFNGSTARQLYDRHVLASLTPDQQQLQRVTLPSTSPANASLSIHEKTALWSVIHQPAEQPR